MRPGAVDISDLERLMDEFENGPGSEFDRTRSFAARWPAEIAKIRRQLHPHLGLMPVRLLDTMMLMNDARKLQD